MNTKPSQNVEAKFSLEDPTPLHVEEHCLKKKVNTQIKNTQFWKRQLGPEKARDTQLMLVITIKDAQVEGLDFDKDIDESQSLVDLVELSNSEPKERDSSSEEVLFDAKSWSDSFVDDTNDQIFPKG